MEKIFIVTALRTPLGSFQGVLADIPAPDLAAGVIKTLLQKNDLQPSAIDEVIIGQVLAGGNGQAPARQAMRTAGLPDSIAALTINKVCGSGLKAVMLAAGSIALGEADLVLAGGMENMTLAPYALPKGRNGYRMGNGEVVDLLIHDALWDPYTGRHMGEVTEKVIADNNLSREELDAYAITSYRRSQRAIEEGRFREEIVPVIKQTRKGEQVIDQDEEPHRVDFAKISGLRPVFAKDGRITAGNASTINDGAAIALVASADAVAKYHLKPMAKLVASATHSQHPDLFPEAPVGAIEKVVKKAGLQMADIDLFEINEAFAAVPLLAIKKFGLDPEKVNVNGGAVSLGHPVGASGCRIVATLLAEMQRRRSRYGLATLCIGGGEAVAAIFEQI